MKEHILRALASRNSIECRSKIKQFRVKVNESIKQRKRAARKLTVIPSCTSAGRTQSKTTIYQPVIIVTFMMTSSRKEKQELLV
jgi:hypothetical protein